MSATLPDKETLNREGIAFSQYLIRQTPTRYVLDKYSDALASKEALINLKILPFDNFLLKLPKHPAILKLMDCYTSAFFKSAVVRKKWFLLIAILESCAPAHLHFDSPDSGSSNVLITKMIWKAFVFLMTLTLSTVLLGPIHLYFAMRHGRSFRNY